MKGKREARLDFSKQLIQDIRGLLWVVTAGGLGLAAYCIRAGYAGTAHGAVCAFYLNMAKSDHREGGITYETARGQMESKGEASI